MFLKFPTLYLAFKYLFSRENKFIFWLNQINILVISLSVAGLITIFSIINGFYAKTQHEYIDKYPHLLITYNYQNLNQQIMKLDNSDYQINFYQKIKDYNKGFPINFSDVLNDSNVKLIDKRLNSNLLYIPSMDLLNQNNSINQIVNLSKKAFVSGYEGNLGHTILNIPTFEVAVNKRFARLNNLKVGDKIILSDPTTSSENIMGIPRYKQMTICMIFDPSNWSDNEFLSDVDVLMNAKDLMKLIQSPTDYNYVNIWLKDPLQVDALEAKAQKVIGNQKDEYTLQSWKDIAKPIFDIIDLQKKILNFIMFIILLIVSVGNINIVLTFFKEKKEDIALMNTLQIDNNTVFNIFILRMILLSFISLVIGFILGYFLTIEADNLIKSTFAIFGIDYKQAFSALGDSIPYQFKINDFLIISGIILFINVILSAIPLISIRKINTASILREHT
jgi:lipoprotein-releasing system permease protein